MTRKHKRSEEELRRELLEQISAMRISCGLWDQGFDWEAKRIAAVIYTILHDGRRPILSILSQLGLRSDIPFLSTAGELTPDMPITMVMTRFRNKEARFIPMCMDPVEWPHFRRLPFDEWWKEPVYLSRAGKTYSRWQLVLAFRNKDGGGHYDNVIDDGVYVELKNFDGGQSFGAVAKNVDWPEPLKNAMPDGAFGIPFGHTSLIRQIAWELDFSLGEHGIVANSPTFSG